MLEENSFRTIEGQEVSWRGMLPFCVSSDVAGVGECARWCHVCALVRSVCQGKWLYIVESLVARVTDGVVVRTRNVQVIPNSISMDLLDKIVGGRSLAS